MKMNPITNHAVTGLIKSITLKALHSSVAIASCLAMVGLTAIHANAQPSKAPMTPAQIPIDHFTQFAKFSNMSPSPDGKYIAGIAPAGQRRGLLVLDIETGKGSVIAVYNDMDIGSVRWISNNRLVYSLTDLKAGLGEQKGNGFYAIDKDGRDRRELSPLTSSSAGSQGIYRGYAFGEVVGPDSDEIYAVGNFRSVRNGDVYKLNTKTGKAELLSFDSPGSVAEWLLVKGKPTVAVSFEDETGQYDVTIKGTSGKWESLVRFGRDEQGWVPIDYVNDAKGEALIILSNLNRNTTAVQRYDLKTRAVVETMAEHPKFDLGWPNPVGNSDDAFASVRQAVLLRNKQDGIIGIRTHLDRENTVWFDKDYQTWQATVDAALPGRVNRIRKLGDTGKVFVRSYSDKQPNEWLVYSPKDKTLTEVVSARPWIKEELMAERRFITYKARDGREIAGFLTVPIGSKGKAVPLIVLPHGGPALRSEYWQWDAESQFFASRGYMVLQPEYRGVHGFGYEHFKAGWKQWGLAMQDDLTDGVTHLAKEGMINKDKVCIVGGSYGGYAVAMGLVKDPDLYKCGINVVGVTASQYMNEVTWTDFAGSKSAEASLYLTVGNPKTDAATLAAGNAVDQAAKIKAPMLLIYGLNDRRVPLINGERMRDALKAAGKKYEWVVYKEEGHGFLLLENRLDHYRRMEQFLAATLQ